MTTTIREVSGADADWVVCQRCEELLYVPRLARNLYVCTSCGSHLRLSAHLRIQQLLDEGSLEAIEEVDRSVDILGFVDTESYPSRLARARDRTGLREGVVAGTGTVGGHQLVIVVMDFGFMGGSLGAAVGKLVTLAADLALYRRIPLLLVSASGGARMQEGAVALMQMAKTSQALAQLDEAGVLTISLITDPTFGGVAASFATLCDVLIAEPGARLGFAGPRVVEQTIRQAPPSGFQNAETLVENGFIDAIRPRHALRDVLIRLLSTGASAPGASGSAGSEPSGDIVVRDPGRLEDVEPWEIVQRSRNLGRPTTLDYVERVFDDFEELRGDRVSGDCAAIVGGIARLGTMPVVVLGHQKGHTIAELTVRNFGMATPDGYRKAARLMRLAAKLSLPVVTLVDTPGAFPGVEAERSGQAVAIADTIRLMTGLPVPTVAVVTGEGGSGGALAIGAADAVLIFSNATYSVISPEGCAAILWSDRALAPEAARALAITPRDLLRLRVVDGVVPEAPGGNQANHGVAADRMRSALIGVLSRLSAVSTADLTAARRARYRSFGETRPTGPSVPGPTRTEWR